MRRHPSVFSGNQANQQKSLQRAGSGLSQKFLFATIREKSGDYYPPYERRETTEQMKEIS
ncbi:hypothetical protein [Methanoregula sp.]|jgi:hypothetical protein|uniref:hypothetical protein n=1 Tax=Methanoregula sp. TaxID=2052170 RepID=UPI003C2AA91B